MAKLIDPLRFEFSGRLGDRVGCIGKYGFYLRSVSQKKLPPPTARQLATRLKLTMATAFLKPMKPLIEKAFRSYNKAKMSAYNKATGIMLSNAFEGEYPDLTINYEKVVLSSGTLLPPIHPDLRSDIPGHISVLWRYTGAGPWCSGDDRAIVQLYEAASHRYQTVAGQATREEEMVTIQIEGQEVEKVHVWLFFCAANGREVSNSRYAGEIEVKR